MSRSLPASLLGVVLAASAAVSYGATVVLGRRLATEGLGPATALGLRFLVATGVLGLALRVRGVPLRPESGRTGQLLLLGGTAYAAESTLFFLALQRGSAAVCAVLFYSYPAIVLAFELVRGRKRVRPGLPLTLALATAGVMLVVTTGGSLTISGPGAAFALGSGAVFAVYLLVGRQLGRGTDPMLAACWLAAGAALSCLGRGLVLDGLDDPTPYWQPLLGYGATTAAVFWLTFGALHRIGASRTAVVMTLEAVSAAALGAAVLGERLGALQLVGGAAILIAAALIAATGGEDDCAETPPAVRRAGSTV